MRLNKTKQLVNVILKDDKSFMNIESTLGLSEACVQLCLIKPYLLMRKHDLLSHARKVLDACQIYDESVKSKSEIQPNKRIKLEKTDDESKLQQQQQQQMQFQQQQLQLYTAALAFHFQNQSGVRNNQLQDLLSRLPLLQSQFLNTNTSTTMSSNENLNELKQKQLALIEANESQLKMNQRCQDEMRSRLAILTASTNENDDQIKLVVDQLKKQLNDLVKKQADLLCEQNRLKNDLETALAPVSSFNLNQEYEDDDNKSSISSSSKTSSSRYETKLNENDNRRLTGNMNDNEDQDESVEINDEENQKL